MSTRLAIWGLQANSNETLHTWDKQKSLSCLPFFCKKKKSSFETKSCLWSLFSFSVTHFYIFAYFVSIYLFFLYRYLLFWILRRNHFCIHAAWCSADWRGAQLAERRWVTAQIRRPDAAFVKRIYEKNKYGDKYKDGILGANAWLA